MKNNFQIITIIVSIAFAVFGILVFSGAIPLGDSPVELGQGTVVLWGTVKSSAIVPLIETLNNANENFSIKYIEKSASTFDQDLLEAIASGVGPDLFFLPDNLAFQYANKIVSIPYKNFPLTNFKSSFAGAGEVFLSSQGILAFPILIDPLVMYYNRSILDANGVVKPPETWDEFLGLIPTLTKRDVENKIIKSGTALGHYSNVVHAKDILATFFMQAGNSIVAERNGDLTSTLSNNTASSDLAPVLQFYADFADPAKSIYSWNKSFSNSSNAFSEENLAFYFGYASELMSLINRNPNQNFFIAPIPQIKGTKFKLTGARVTGIAIASFSKNFDTAYIAASQMVTGDFAKDLALALSVAPARRDLLSMKPDDAYSPIFYNSALYARSWLDPSDKDTDDIFRGMIDGVLSNNLSPRDSIRDASDRLDFLLIK